MATEPRWARDTALEMETVAAVVEGGLSKQSLLQGRQEPARKASLTGAICTRPKISHIFLAPSVSTPSHVARERVSSCTPTCTVSLPTAPSLRFPATGASEVHFRIHDSPRSQLLHSSTTVLSSTRPRDAVVQCPPPSVHVARSRAFAHRIVIPTLPSPARRVRPWRKTSKVAAVTLCLFRYSPARPSHLQHFDRVLDPPNGFAGIIERGPTTSDNGTGGA